MKKNNKVHNFFSPLLLFSSSLISTQLYAGGAYIPELMSFSSAGTAGAFNQVNDMDAMAALSNPAGLTNLDKNQVEGGINILIPEIEFDASRTPASGGSNGGSAGEVTPVPGVAFTHSVKEGFRKRFVFL